MSGTGPKAMAVILAAGASRRMGQPKALLQLTGKTFLTILVETFERAGVRPMAVLGADAELIAKAHPWLPWVHNTEWPSGQFSSVRAGLRAALAQGATSIFIHPVDAPRLSSATVVALREALREENEVAVPAGNSRLGHPLAMSALAAHAVLDSDAETLWDAVTPLSPRRVRVKDPGAFENINQPEEYERIVARPPPLPKR